MDGSRGSSCSAGTGRDTGHQTAAVAHLLVLPAVVAPPPAVAVAAPPLAVAAMPPAVAATSPAVVSQPAAVAVPLG